MAQEQQLSQEVRARKVFVVKSGCSIMFAAKNAKGDTKRFHVKEGEEIKLIDQEDLDAFLAQGVVEKKIVEV